MRFVTCVTLVALLSCAGRLQAETVHESATPGTAGQATGVALSEGILGQFLGSRFTLTEPVEVEQIGGHLGNGSGTLFGAIISLADATALPIGSPFDPSEVRASTIFDPGSPSSHFLTPLSVSLAPGDYALIFGAGEFGSSSTTGFMPSNNTDLPGASYFRWDGMTSAWNPTTTTGLRFIVTGYVIPEPSSIFLLISTAVAGLLAMIAFRCRKQGVIGS